MTNRATFKEADLKRFAKVVQSQGVTITLSAPDGYSYQIAPESATVAPETPLDAWKAKRAGDNERRS